jgi:hypothetical protein
LEVPREVRAGSGLDRDVEAGETVGENCTANCDGGTRIECDCTP